MIVVDTNIISYFYLHSEHSHLAEQIFTKDPAWSAPLLWRSEFRNVLALYIRKAIITLPEAVEIFSWAAELFQGNEYEVHSAHVLQLSRSSGCSAYDCEFVNLAQDLGVYLITQDKKILDNFPATALSMRAFLAVS